MTRLSFLSKAEKRQFDSPPVLTQHQRPAWFAITNDVRRTLSSLRTPVNKIGFVLQLGYFRHSGKFFQRSDFRQRDIKYIARQLSISEHVDLDQYQPSRMAQHQSRILSLLSWTPFDEKSATIVAEHIQFQAHQQVKPEQIFSASVDFCWKNRLEIPSYHQLSNVITDSFNIVETDLLNTLQQSLTTEDTAVLDNLLDTSESQHPLLVNIKFISQSVRATDIKDSAEILEKLNEYVSQFQSCYSDLSISDQATEYYATWVSKASLAQLQQFPNPYKRYLYLLGFIKHQHCLRQDLLMDTLLKCTRMAINAARKQDDRQALENRQEQKVAIRTINHDRKSQRQLLAEITRIVRITDEEQSPSQRMTQLQQLLDDYEALQNDTEKQALDRYEQLIDQQTDEFDEYQALTAQSLRLQRRIAPILSVLMFDPVSSNPELLHAVQHFQQNRGQIGPAPPLAFLPESKQTLFTDTHRPSLYKALLFQQIALSVRAGRLNLKHSYRYRAIQDYLIPDALWRADKERMLVLSGLSKFANGISVLDGIKSTLDSTYRQVNQRYHDGDNSYLKVDEKGKVNVQTPATEFSVAGDIGTLLADNGIVPVLQILREINQEYDFTHCLKHLSPKHHKLKPTAETILAGILGKGCNIGLDKLSQISVGLNASTLNNTVTWFFSLKNLQSANAVLIKALDSLALSEAFISQPGQLHTGSDGRKVGVSAESLHANHSFKYFGKDKGVALYTFLDERHALFYSTIISASEREAAYVIDGLMQNEVIKSDIHSTDTHGYTESIFAAAHLIDTAFAPRIKKIQHQKLYSFSSKATHQRKGQVILPSRTIDHRLILRHWDDILRFIATIKLRHSSASQLFKRLSSYASDHPLYKALKEFGRLIKTQFILSYYDDLELRQRIEKQLNKVELSNRFSKAIFFANNQEFQVGNLVDQQITATCTALIQNAIVLWNAMVLSQRLVDTPDQEQRHHLLTSIRSGSLLSWQHVNLQGEYDFRPMAANEDRFDKVKILRLRLQEM